MENLAGPSLLQAFFDHATDEVLGSMDDPTKARLRLSCKYAKAFVDGTVTIAKGGVSSLETILSCDWHLSELWIQRDNLTETKFSQNTFTPLLHALCLKFPTLQGLEINSPPYVFDLPVNIGQLSNLRTLCVLGSYCTDLPASFGQLSSVKRLELDAYVLPERSRQSTISIEGLAPLKQLTQLKYLRLDGSLVRQRLFPGWLGSCHFPVLENLTLGNGMPSLPSSISNFSSLTALIVGESTISEVPESIGSLSLLKKLHLPFAIRLVSLLTSISKLTALEELDVTTDMQSFALIEHLNKITKLHFTCLNEEELMPYPDFLWTFMSLQALQLWHSDVPSLPDALGNLKNLEVLHLQFHKNIEELPEALGNLTCLTHLRITDCHRLLKLPESIGILKILRQLGIYRCHRLTTLPESIGNLQSLETLSLTLGGSFECLPSSLGKLHALKELIINNAGALSLPESFADLVLDKPVEECPLKRVIFTGKLVNGPRVALALSALRGHAEILV